MLKEGYSGKKLLKEFKNRQAKIRTSVIHMLDEAEAAAKGKTEYMTIKDVFED